MMMMMITIICDILTAANLKVASNTRHGTLSTLNSYINLYVS
jgi:hypothetical protein